MKKSGGTKILPYVAIINYNSLVASTESFYISTSSSSVFYVFDLLKEATIGGTVYVIGIATPRDI